MEREFEGMMCWVPPSMSTSLSLEPDPTDTSSRRRSVVSVPFSHVTDHHQTSIPPAGVRRGGGPGAPTGAGAGPRPVGSAHAHGRAGSGPDRGYEHRGGSPIPCRLPRDVVGG